MAKKTVKTQNSGAAASRFPWPVLVAGALLLVIGGGLALWQSAAGSGGAPKLVVSETTVDAGYQKFNAPVQSAFRLRNEGAGPLKILNEPEVELRAGC